MIIKSVYIKAIFAALSLLTFGVKGDSCNKNSLIYEDLKCKPIFDDAHPTCPSSYDCSHLEQVPDGKCLYHGKLYNTHENLPADETYADCNVACTCIGTSKVRCAILDCPEWLGSWPLPGCSLKYELGKCCAIGNICPNSKNLHKCVVDGKEYLEGQKFDHPKEKCTTCVCDKKFKDDLGAICRKDTCSAEIRSGDKISKYYAAVYGGKDHCCPFEWIPRTGKEKIVKSTKPSGSLKCKFHGESLNLGDKFEEVEIKSNYERIELKCECSLPPFVTCVRKQIFDKSKAPAHLKPYLPTD
ncbi:PREDICTED: uncharacterized protein LOC108567123 [Nicrophorus vespilloides]|uniref:Uncharacterized protein LOC108567123 n=1 Tax=Nicrophorus vespilloides TaxID=110193 RepID=A0ABM1N7T5_NICVS|nr:PREDICTED: uncharacterized protein LOC108567123 [Nicrophorus vespilloides]